MLSMPSTVAITCTQPRCDGITADLIASQSNKKINAIAHPILSITITGTPMPKGDFDAVLITSTHAITDALPHELPYIAVGEHTALQLQELGYTVVTIGHGGVRDLDLNGYNRILYPCAVNPSFTPSNTVPWTVYTSSIATDFNWVNNVDIITVFSASAAHALRPYVPPHIHLICLSNTIVNIFNDHPIGNLAVCEKPHYDDMKFLIQSMTRTDN